MTNKTDKKVGTFIGVPYDWRKPTAARLKSRTWNPQGPFVTRKWYGWGYDVNAYAIIHPLQWRRARSRAKSK